MRTRGIAFALLAAAVGAPAAGQERLSIDPSSRDRSQVFLGADPSKVVAAELAFARLAQDKGQWTAFSETSTDEAVMFVPAATNARKYLKGRPNPAVAVKWQPHQVWMSCDGSLAVTKGAWQRPEGSGYFTTVWQRQKDGRYKWVMDQGDKLAQPLPEPEMIGGKVAECPKASDDRRRRNPKPAMATISPPTCEGQQCRGGGAASDGTLVYAYSVAPSGARRFTVQLRQDGALREVLLSEVAAG